MTNKFEIGKHVFDELLKNLEKNITKIFIEAEKDYFTLHDHRHCQNVAIMADEIVTEAKLMLNDFEFFLLRSAIWLHDVGMNTNIARSYFLENKLDYSDKRRRKEHHIISSWYLLRKGKELFNISESHFEAEIKNSLINTPLFENILRIISIVIRYHRKNENIIQCQQIRLINKCEIRVQLLSSILRLADSLHIDSSRVDYSFYSLIQMSYHYMESKIHWLSAYFVSSVYLLNQKVIINLDVPNFEKYIEIDYESKQNSSEEDKDDKKSNYLRKEKLIWNEGINTLKFIIEKDIYAELQSVNEIFVDNKMPPYVKVEVNISHVNGYNIGKYREIKSVLNELDILFSPNSTKVIDKVLEGTEELIKKENTDNNHFVFLFRQLLDYFDDISENKKSHVALQHIVKKLKKFENESRKKEPSSKLKALKQFKELIKEHKGKISEDFKIKAKGEEIIPKKTKNIVLFGFSSTVINILSEVDNYYLLDDECNKNKTKKNIYILEGSTKRRFTYNNQIEYCDAIRYSTEINKIKDFNTFIIPDIGFASLINNLIINSKGKDDIKTNTIILLGACGIDKTFNCVSSSGHLSIAIIAKNFEIPVKFVLDSLKISEKDLDKNIITNNQRKSEWLTSQPIYSNELEFYNIKTINFRDDFIDSKYIDEIYLDNNRIISKDYKTEKIVSFFEEKSEEIEKILN